MPNGRIKVIITGKNIIKLGKDIFRPQNKIRRRWITVLWDELGRLRITKTNTKGIEIINLGVIELNENL